MKEKYDKSYSAIPITEGPLLSFLHDIAFKSFYHLSIYRFLEMDDEKAEKVKSLYRDHTKELTQLTLIPEKMTLIGERTLAFVLKIEDTEPLRRIYNTFEENFPESASLNRYMPHITVKNGVLNPRSSKFSDKRVNVQPFSAKHIGLYYRTEENATALLVCHHI